MRLDKERRIKREIRNNRSISTGAVPIREAAVVVFLVVWGSCYKYCTAFDSRTVVN